MTTIHMSSYSLIRKEEMERYCNGLETEKNSVNDDLEILFEDLRVEKEPDDFVQCYFLPKLTEEELESVYRIDESYDAFKVADDFIVANRATHFYKKNFLSDSWYPQLGSPKLFSRIDQSRIIPSRRPGNTTLGPTRIHEKNISLEMGCPVSLYSL